MGTICEKQAELVNPNPIEEIWRQTIAQQTHLAYRGFGKLDEMNNCNIVGKKICSRAILLNSDIQVSGNACFVSIQMIRK